MMRVGAAVRMPILTLLIVLLASCDSGSSGTSSEADTNEPNSNGADTEQEAELEPRLITVYSGDLCPLDGVRVLLNGAQGQLIDELSTSSDGTFDLNLVPEGGSMGVVRRVNLQTFSGSRTLTAIQHYDADLLSEKSSVHFSGADPECLVEQPTATESFTVIVENAAEFNEYLYSSPQSSTDSTNSTQILNLVDGLVIVIGYPSSGERKYALIDTSTVSAGEEVRVTLDQPMREVQVNALADVNPGSIRLDWFSESGERYNLSTSNVFSQAMKVYVIDEPGRIAVSSQAIMDPSRVDESVFGDAQTVDSLTFIGRNSDLQNPMLADGRFYYWSSIKTVSFSLGTIDYGNVYHSYMAAGEQNPLVMPSVPSDILIAGESVEDRFLSLSSIDPRIYTTGAGAAELRVDGRELKFFGPVAYRQDRSFTYSARNIVD